MAALASPSRRQPQASALPAASLAARNALVLQHLPLADAIASVIARRLFPLVERDDLIQVAREALLRSVPRCKAGEPAEPYLRRCITGALQHHLRDRVRLVRISRRQHEKGTCPLGHVSLDVQIEGEHSLLDQLAAPAAELASGFGAEELALEQLVEQLPAAQATALRLTLLEGLSLRAAGLKLGISAMAVQRGTERSRASRATWIRSSRSTSGNRRRAMAEAMASARGRCSSTKALRACRAERLREEAGEAIGRTAENPTPSGRP